ncbi:MAG TPA: VOC family protein [Azospirillaceae bacterium]|nr:VOC family protein [Azospirillaceae bacterium]
MRATVLALAAVLATAAPAALAQGTPAPAAKEEYKGSFFKRSTLLVSDIERSLKIYRDILGFRQDGGISENSPTSYSYDVFNIDKSAKMRMAMLSAGDQQIRTLALTEVKGQKLVVPDSPRAAAVVINVKNIKDIMAKVSAMGLKTIPGRPSRTPEGITFQEEAFVDPDGHLVVIYELNPK